MKTHLLLLSAAFLLGLPACSKKPDAAAPGNLPSVQVHLQTVEAKPHIASEEVTGTIRPKLQTAIAPEVTARIEKMLVVPGSRVKKGDPLVQLDTRDARAKLEQAKAVFIQAEQNLKRYTALVASKAASQADYETAVANHRVAQASLEQAQTALTYTTVTAPFDGVITKKSADVGDLASPYKAILEMEDPRALRFETDIPEAIIGSVSLGTVLPVRTGTLSLTGTVGEMTPVADPQSRTFLVKLDLPPTPGLRTGQFGRVSIPLSETSVLRIPSSAVIRRGQMELAFTVKNSRAQLRIIKTGKRFGSEIEVVSGIETGEQVVTNNPSLLRDGQPVEIQSK